MLSIQLLNGIGDVVKNVSQFSSQVDNSTINHFKEFVGFINQPVFKYVPECKNWHLGLLVLGRCVSELPMTRTKALVAKMLDKYPELGGFIVVGTAVLIYIIIY